MKIRNAVFAKVALATLLGLSGQAQAQWNAYNDFYLSPTAGGWTGATSPSSALGTAWGYYAANVNGWGYPTSIGTYFTPTGAGSGSQNMYQYSNVAPIGAGTSVGAPGWANTGGAGFAYYSDTFSWGSSLGRYDNAWDPGTPGYSQGQSNFIWMQSAYLSNAAAAPNGPAEGIAAVLTWTAPSAGAYQFAGQFLAGNQPLNSAAVAVVTSSGALLSRTVLSNNSAQNFSLMATFAGGDTVQFQVGNNFSTGNAVGLQVTATAIPEPSSGLLLTAGLGVLGLVRRLRRQA